MLDQFVVLHNSQKTQDFSRFSGRWVPWQTCLRRVAFGRHVALSTQNIHPDTQVFIGEKAYQFALEVVCGLHSPMIGETEVYGQFKQLLEGVISDESSDVFVRQWLEDINLDAKQIRQKHLIGLGSFSYGSVVRKIAKPFDSICFLGAGIFVKDILPWVRKSKKSIFVSCRNPVKARSVLQEHVEYVQLTDLGQLLPDSGLLVICAPMSSDQIKGWMAQYGHRFGHILDLRGESAEDPLWGRVPVTTLQQVFGQLESTRQHARDRIDLARNLIQNLSQQKNHQMQVRPFGWHDIA